VESSSWFDPSGGGVGGNAEGVYMSEFGVRRRFVILLKGFSSTFRRRDR
jgi:hypothetical protein